MDNLESLFEKKQYELVASLTSESKDPKERLLRLSSLIMLNKVNEALDEIENHQEMFDKSYPQKVMKIHFESLLQSKLYSEARLALKHYQDLPYISQEVEEYLRSMDVTIDEQEHQKSSSIPLEEICERLEKEKDSELLLEALGYLRIYNLSQLIDSLKVLLVREDVKPYYRAIALFSLMEQDYSKEIKFLSEGEIITLTPSKLKTPFEDKNFFEVIKGIEVESNHNVTLKETAISLFSSYVINTFPSDIYKDGIAELTKAFVHLGKKYINESSSENDPKALALVTKIIPIIEK